MIAALFVQYGGTYYGLDNVIPYGIGGKRGTYRNRSAMDYFGPHPVIAHPECSVWCRQARVNESRYGHKVGNDGGMFDFALRTVRRYGGVLEHPAFTLAWPHFKLPSPPPAGWEATGDGAWVCQVAQRNYGHKATKKTWLYVVTPRKPPELIWGDGPPPGAWISTDRPRAELAAMGISQLSKREAKRTPPAFRDLLISIAESAGTSGERR